MNRPLIMLMVLAFAGTFAQPSPKEHFGFAIGDDFHLANFTQTEAYFNKLTASDRVRLVSMGQTEEGRNHPMLVITSPENHRKLDQIREVSVKMANASGITEEQARALAAEGKAVVWIDGGLHATETVGIHQLVETAWQLATRTDAETLRILDKVVVLMVHANPDGQELVSNWYMREPVKEKRKLDHLPKLYQKYIGHDNNRDFYMLNMKETQNMARQLFIEWLPQVMYNHHQSGPAGSVLAGPPYRDPFNHVFDPLCITGLDGLGASMINRLNQEGKPGYTRLDGSVFSTWYNGGLRTTTYFHNMLGLLTEIIGNPTPMSVPVVPSRLVPNNDTPFPVTPRKWHFRQSIDYSVSLNYAVLDYAARHSDQLLYNIWRMGMNSIERGSRDTWTPFPAKVEAVNTSWKNRPKKSEQPSSQRNPFDETPSGITSKFYDSVFHLPANRDPRGYVLPADQPDRASAIRFLNALIRTGVRVQVAEADFQVGQHKYPSGSFVVKTNQPFRPHVLDLFEPQDHPNDFQYPGGPPIRPYDAAGWTLAFQMGIAFDRHLEDFTGPFRELPYGETIPLTGTIKGTGSGYMLHAGSNAAFIAVNDLLKAGVTVYRTATASAGFPAGSFYIPAGSKSKSILDNSAKSSALVATGVIRMPSGMSKVTPQRIALWDVYGGSMPSGWIRWLAEQYHFQAEVIFPKTIDQGNLRAKYDVLILVGGSVPALKNENPEWGWNRRDPKPEEIPSEYHDKLGKITVDKSIPELKKFMEAGGKVICIGSGTNLAYHLGLPVKNALTEIGPNGNERTIPSDKYYVPGSILRVKVDSTVQATWGARSVADVYFENSPVFKLAPEAVAQGKVRPLAWFGEEAPLRSGWAWGQQYLKGGVAAFEATIGKGSLVCYGPEITFRGQSHGTFRFLFNQLTSTSPATRITVEGSKP